MTVYVRIRIAAENYALPVANVIEVSALDEVTAVPGSGPEILGVRNLRGSILPVVDLAALLQVRTDGPASRLLVVASGERRAGFPIDGVSDVGELPESVDEAESGLLLGAALVDGDLVGVIDVQRVFDAVLPRNAKSVPAGPP